MGSHMQHNAKRRRLDDDDENVDAFKSGTRFKPTEPREWTVSVAIPTSIITDCTTREQRTVNTGRIARALAVFSVDEIIIYDDAPAESKKPVPDDTEEYTGDIDPAHFMHHILTYLETPPFMRKQLFSIHPNLKFQGLLPSMDMPHHPHKDEWLPYREGMTIQGKPKPGKKTLVDIGMREPVSIADAIPLKTRLTLHVPDDRSDPEPVHPTAPRTDGGYFWGFSVRKCSSLSAVFTESPYESGYDVSVGTSERGVPLSKAFPDVTSTATFSHLLVAFGGPRGLEYAAMNDPDLSEMNIAGGKTRELFDHWINVLPFQGSRSIRTEEAVFIALTAMRRLWQMD